MRDVTASPAVVVSGAGVTRTAWDTSGGRNGRAPGGRRFRAASPAGAGPRFLTSASARRATLIGEATTEHAHDVTDHDAIRATLAAYCQALDDGRFDDWVEMFTDDVAFAVMDRLERGPAAVRAFVEPVQQAGSRGRHVLSEPLIAVDGDAATVTTDFCFLSPELTVTAAGRYHDVMAREGDRWLIAAREIVFLGESPRGIPDGGDGTSVR